MRNADADVEERP